MCFRVSTLDILRCYLPFIYHLTTFRERITGSVALPLSPWCRACRRLEGSVDGDSVSLILRRAADCLLARPGGPSLGAVRQNHDGQLLQNLDPDAARLLVIAHDVLKFTVPLLGPVALAIPICVGYQT